MMTTNPPLELTVPNTNVLSGAVSLSLVADGPLLWTGNEPSSSSLNM